MRKDNLAHFARPEETRPRDGRWLQPLGSSEEDTQPGDGWISDCVSHHLPIVATTRPQIPTVVLHEF